MLMRSGENPDESGTIVFAASARPLVSILIPSSNQAGLLEVCLKSLRRNIGANLPYEVIVVLNAATAEVRSFVRDRTQGLVVLESSANLGVAGGYNRARAVARGDYLMLLHDDAEIEPGWMESLLETLASHPAAGAVGSLQLFPDGTPQRAGSILWQNALSSPPWGGGEPEPWIFPQVRPVDYVGTCSSLVRATTWDAAGGMDEEIYPAYYVDADLCMRIHQLGQTVLCDPRSRVKHHQGASTNKRFRYFINQRNQLYFTNKWAAELARQEPYAPDDPAAVARAHQVTARVAAELTKCWPGPPPLSPPPALFDPAEHERQHLTRELALFSAYQKRLEAAADRLTGLVEKADAALAVEKQQSARQQAAIVKLKRRCSHLNARLKQSRMNPLRRWLVRLRKRFMELC